MSSFDANPQDPKPSSKPPQHNRLAIPPNVVIPPNWSTDPSTLHSEFTLHFDSKRYGLPPSNPIAQSRNNLEYLLDTGTDYFLFNAISDELYRIDHPTELSNIFNAMADHSLKATEIEAFPLVQDYEEMGDWSFDEETLQRILDRVQVQVPARYFGGASHFAPVMGLLDKDVLLFKHDWKYYIWNQDSLYRVETPTTLDSIVSTLIEEGFEPGLSLKTSLVTTTGKE